jgi:cytochrome b involved in lipid metabolism
MAETKTYTLEDLKQHTTESDCWLAIHGKVYNVTDFLDEHPGEK